MRIKQPADLASPQLKIDNYLDNVEKFWEKNPFFYDKSQIFWMWNKTESYWEMIDEIDLMNCIDRELGFAGQTINSRIKNNYLEAFKRVGRERIPTPAPKSWVQFKDKIFDINTRETFEALPQYFICNPIPWELGTDSKTPTIDKLITEWVGYENKDVLYEVIAYCCYTDYPIHLIFCLTGIGRNGKSSFQKLLTRFLGSNNISSTELDNLLESRFESCKLYKKLACMMGETNFGVINKTSLIKRLCGQDLIGFEFKQKKPFDDYNYAKIIINSNSLPTSEDTSEGFYRRWLIIDFPNNFPEGKDIIDSIPEQEYSALSKKVQEILPNLIDLGVFTNMGEIEDRKQKYILTSNPLGLFIDTFCVKDDVNAYIKYSELYTNYIKFLIKIKKRQVNYKEFNSALLAAGYERDKTSRQINGIWINGWWILGLKFNGEWEKFVTVVTDVTDFQLTSKYINKRVENIVTTVTPITKVMETKVEDNIY